MTMPKGYLTRKHVKHIPIVHSHAVLSSDDQIITIGYYPVSKTPNRSVIPIPDDQTPHAGWYYNRKTRRFQKQVPE